MFISRIKLNIKGKNIERFIKRLVTNKIEILKMNYINYNEVNIMIYKKDYDKVINLKSVYEITDLNIYGVVKIKKVLNIYKHIIIGSFISLILILFLSNMIFEVKVIHNNLELRNLIINELENYSIEKYKFKKNFNDIQNIKKEILEKYKNKIEWLEIEEVGTSYIVRVEERIIINNIKEAKHQNIVAGKSGVLKKIIAYDGEVVKDVNMFVNKGDIVISGNIYLNEKIKDIVRADGLIYAEVWYNVCVEYPYIYNEIKYTGNKGKVYALKVFDAVFELNNKFEEKIYEEKIILGHNLLPISLVLQNQKEIKTTSEILTEQQAMDKAIEMAKIKMNDKLNDDENIIDYKVLKTTIKEDKIVLDVFFSVLENITDHQVIEESDINVS